MKYSGIRRSTPFLFLMLSLPLVVVVPVRARAKISGGGGKAIVVDVFQPPKGSYPAGYVDVFRGEVQPQIDEALGFKKEGNSWKFAGVYYGGPAE